MSPTCVHLHDGESLIFEENTDQNVCVICRNQNSSWIGQTDTWTNEVFFRGLESQSNVNDNIEHLEDSPLLENISDGFEDSLDPRSHCHDSLSKSDSKDTNAWKKLTLAALFCFSFMVAELIGGYIADSLAIMTDAAHLFSDFIGFFISLIAIWVGQKSATRYMTFGYYRAEVLGALLSILTIWVLAGVFSAFAISRLYKQDYNIDANTMIIVAALGLTVNIIMGCILHGFCHGHSHGLPSADTSSENINVRAAAAHVLGDLLQSVGVLIAAIVIKVYPEAKIADPICTILFSVLVICTTVRVGKDSLWFLLEGSPVNSQIIISDLGKLDGVQHIHNLHIWSLAPEKHAATVHLAVDKFCDRDALINKATSIIQNKIKMVSCTVQVEVYNRETIKSCKRCQSVVSLEC